MTHRPRDISRYARWGIPFAGAALSFCVFLCVLRIRNGPCGYDVYYYALQTRALETGGELLFSDASLVYTALLWLNRVINNPVLSTQVLSALSLACVYGCLLRLGLRRGLSFYRIAAASIAVFNPAVFYLLLEFTKNSFSLALFFCAYLFLTCGGGYASPRKSAPRFFAGLAFLAVCALSHRVMLAPAFLFVLHAGAAHAWGRLQSSAHKNRIFAVCAVSACAGIAVILAAADASIFDRLPPLDVYEPVHRLVQLSGNQLLATERVFYTLLQISLVFLVPYMAIRRRRFSTPECVFALSAWLCVFPFLRFSWDELGFRLLILAPLMAAPWLMSLGDTAKPPRGLNMSGIIFAAGGIVFTVSAIAQLAPAKGPDYKLYEKVFAGIENLARGRRLIAHRGLAGFLWYEKGIRSENFIPTENPDTYLRLVYAFAPEILEPYLAPGDPVPLALGARYTLAEEYIWQRFYMDRQDLHFLKSELNPWLPRPASGFLINQEVSRFLSPVSSAQDGP
jgi:hypothetical protein